ncbi:MAG: PEP/pyruvate-binding domain-containing protein [Myxococcota bacterium]
MNRDELERSFDRFRFREDAARSLMRERVGQILLVTTFYDAFIFEQDGVLADHLIGGYTALDTAAPPHVTSVSTGSAALAALATQPFDLVITSLRIGDITPVELAARVRAARPGTPVILALNNEADLARMGAIKDQLAAFDEVFLCAGNSDVFVAMVKLVEDRKNLAHDTEVGLVRVVLLIEDSIAAYSAFLPGLYAQLTKQTHYLLSEEVTPANRQLRMKMRPKVVLAHNVAEAERAYRELGDSLLCVITDVQLLRQGALDDEAGVRFIEAIRADGCKVPVLIQSADEQNRQRAWTLGAHFIDKRSPFRMAELRDFIVHQLGFGDFVFRTADGQEHGRVGTVAEFMARLQTVPEAALVYHAGNDHYSAWLIAHGEVAFAKRIKPLKAQDFPDTAAMRSYLVDIFDEIERSKRRGRVVDATSWDQLSRAEILRLREGSLGGKGRGLAFLNALLWALDYKQRYPAIEVTLPLTAVIGTAEFDEFLERNGVSRAVTSLPDAEIRAAFLAGSLSPALMGRLRKLVEHVHAPLAVRSSGLLEDSQSTPFAGVYRTLMIANSAASLEVRLAELADAIKLVFACVFEASARAYIEGAKFNLDEEKMAVVVQEICGEQHGTTWYPDFSGVAQSYTFYPTGPIRAQDGIAVVAPGLGKSVVEGQRAVRFCPRFPGHDLLSPDEQRRQAPRDLWVLDRHAAAMAPAESGDGALVRIGLRDLEAHGTLAALASVWDLENDRMIDGLHGPGPRIITFAEVLKYKTFPLAELLCELLDAGEQAMGVPVEIEFACIPRRHLAGTRKPVFYPLQIRPLNVRHEAVEVAPLVRAQAEREFVYSVEALGNGVSAGLRHVLYVDAKSFSVTDTLAIRDEVAELNRRLRERQTSYVLIGPGRWGSRDRFLGIPVGWPDISEARAIGEVDLDDFRVSASQGTHFLHNLMTMSVGYLKVPFASQASWVDWDWLEAQAVVEQSAHCRVVETAEPFDVQLDGRSGRARFVRGGGRA